MINHRAKFPNGKEFALWWMVKWVEWPSWKIAFQFQFFLKERDFQKKASFSFSIATLTHSTRLAQKGLANKVCGSSHFMFVFHYFFWPAKLKVAYSLCSSECRIVLTTKHCTLLFHSTFISPLYYLPLGVLKSRSVWSPGGKSHWSTNL